MGLKPIYLLADSQLLFWRDEDGALFLNSIRRRVDIDSAKAAYLGASNGDDPAYYTIFEAAMEGLGVTRRRMVLSSFTPPDADFLAESDIILLAGGDALSGWERFVGNGAREAVTTRYLEGALLIGVSAGALQLGLCAYSQEEFSRYAQVETFKFVPLVVGVHEEKRDWAALKNAMQLVGEGVQGVGIPTGGGAVYHPDGSLSPVRYPLSMFALTGEKFSRSVLFESGDEQLIDATGITN